MGVEPTSQPWEGRILPMYYTRKDVNIIHQKRTVFNSEFLSMGLFRWLLTCFLRDKCKLVCGVTRRGEKWGFNVQLP